MVDIFTPHHPLCGSYNCFKSLPFFMALLPINISMGRYPHVRYHPYQDIAYHSVFPTHFAQWSLVPPCSNLPFVVDHTFSLQSTKLVKQFYIDKRLKVIVKSYFLSWFLISLSYTYIISYFFLKIKFFLKTPQIFFLRALASELSLLKQKKSRIRTYDLGVNST